MNIFPNPTASILIIGNEILSGQVQDLNVAYIAKRLQEMGIDLKEVRMVGDEESHIVKTLNELRKLYTYVFTTGGIGPTHDDITAAAVAQAFSRGLETNKEACRRIFEQYPQGGPTYSRMRMSEMPKDVLLIDNPISAAPGFQIENVFVLAGIPHIMQAMFETLVPRLQKGQARRSVSVFCSLGEGAIAVELGEIQKEFRDIEIGSYPRWGQEHEKGVRIVLKGNHADRLQEAARRVIQMFEKHECSPKLE